MSTIGEVARRSRERFPTLAAVIDGDVTLTFAELSAESDKTARGLIALGIEKGDRVALWAPNLWEWIVAAIGVHTLGAVLVPINTRFLGKEAAYVLRKSKARALLTVRDFLGKDYVDLLDRLEDETLPDLGPIVMLRGEAGPKGRVGGERLTFRELLARGESVAPAEVEERAAEVSPRDVCDILFTSGTTGKPKGVMSTHAQTLRAFQTWSDTVGLRAGDRYLVVVPFFHSFGYKAGWLAALMSGATVLPQAVFDANAVLKRIARDRIQVLPGPPALYQTILARADLADFDLSSLRLAVTGAAVIPVELIHRMKRELSFETVITAYGLTEATGVSTMCRMDDDPETIATTSGRAIDGVEVLVVGEDGTEMTRGEPGEIVVRGFSVMQGYFEDEDATRDAIDAEGFLHTGDIGVMDARGYLRITDRKKDVFIVGGFNAYPAEIEGALSAHEAVAQVAVIGVPDARLGEVGMAYVVLREGKVVSPDELIAWSRNQMANYKVPRRVEIVQALPVNATGKVLKYELRARAAAQVP